MSQNTPITLARLRLVREMPYLAAALWALAPVEKPGLGTLGVDKYWRLYWDPEAVAAWSIEETAGVLYHEINHLLRDHPDRGEGKDAEVMNLAADAEINDNLNEFPFPLPKIDYVTPEKFNLPPGKLAEYYYDELSKTIDKLKQALSNAQSDGGDGKQKGSMTMPGAGKCGSAAHGGSEDYEDGPPKPGEQGLSQTEGELLKKQVAKDIKQSGRGDVPGSWERWAEDKLSVKINWRNKLGTLIRNSYTMAAGAKDYTYRRPSRRDYGDIIMPTAYQPVPNLAVVVDTSGSMGNVQLAQCLAEIDGILKATGVQGGITVLSVDAAVAAVKQVFNSEQVKLDGGGGTDMRIGITHASKLKPIPDICIVLTDGDTPWPAAPIRGMATIACIIPSYYGADWVSEQLPGWMKSRAVVIDDIDRKGRRK